MTDTATQSSRTRIALALALALVGTALSGVLLLEHRGEGDGLAVVQQVCGEGAGSGCETVARSAWSEVAGVPLAALGLTFYLVLAAALVLGLLAQDDVRALLARAALLAAAAALAGDVALLGIQAFAIGAYCKLCIATYVVNGAILFALLPAWRGAPEPGPLLARPDGRLAAAGLALLVASVAVAVWAGDRALVERARLREKQIQATMLGTLPTPAATPQPAATPLPSTGDAGTDLRRSQEETRAARAEAERLRGILDDQQKLGEYLQQKAADAFEKAPVQKLDLASAPQKGPEIAPIHVVEFSDFLCPYCRGLAGALAGFLPQSQGRVTIHFKNYPLDKACNPSLPKTVHDGACVVAAAAICANEQGHFWAFHDRVFANPPNNPKLEDVLRIAADAGLDRASLETCIASSRARERLASEVAEATRVGVQATPTVFINGKRLERVNDFLVAIDRESRRLGLAPLPAPRQGP